MPRYTTNRPRLSELRVRFAAEKRRGGLNQNNVYTHGTHSVYQVGLGGIMDIRGEMDTHQMHISLNMNTPFEGVPVFVKLL